MIPEDEIQEFFTLPIDERIDKFIEYELVPKEQVTALKQSIILNAIREKFPDLFFMYFTDLLEQGTPEYNRCHQAYMNTLMGIM